MSFYLVHVSAWLASILFLAARTHWVSANLRKRFDQLGVAVLWVHIAIAYALVHNGSHLAAVEHVALRTQESIGIQTGIGIYANFFAALLWGLIAYGVIVHRQLKLLWISESFLWLMFFSASILFAERYSAAVFTLLFLVVVSSHWNRIRRLQQPVSHLDS